MGYISNDTRGTSGPYRFGHRLAREQNEQADRGDVHDDREPVHHDDRARQDDQEPGARVLLCTVEVHGRLVEAFEAGAPKNTHNAPGVP